MARKDPPSGYVVALEISAEMISGFASAALVHWLRAVPPGAALTEEANSGQSVRTSARRAIEIE